TTTPTSNGSYYLVSQAGTQSITGLTENYEAGDQVISNGTGWFRIRSSLVDGSVSEGKIAAAAVSPAKTTFIASKLGKNL
ncbi:hypothetical protein BWI93_01990, partial [Siphonobacter sp. BAB-5385]|uniref:hypothetical protein n=1 Tax=Siphonobacter sp. BAB-5385 TaxID=1864822 RepID=UPI000BC4D255